MNTEEHLRRHAQKTSNGNWVGDSDFYQEMLELYGTRLWSTVPHLLAYPEHDARCCGLIIAGTRSPESREAMLLIYPFMRDAHPLVRLTAFQQLLAFSRVEKQVEEMAYQIQAEEWNSADQVPCVMAIRLLLKANFAKYRSEMTPKLEVIHDLEFGKSMVTDLVMEAYKDCGGW
jgi:hypothetical protein